MFGWASRFYRLKGRGFSKGILDMLTICLETPKQTKKKQHKKWSRSNL